jgi:hypothetical protein
VPGETFKRYGPLAEDIEEVKAVVNELEHDVLTKFYYTMDCSGEIRAFKWGIQQGD